MELTVIIPAGGSGSRIGGTPKQFRLLGGRPILAQTIKALCNWREGLRVVVAAPANDIANVEKMLAGVIDGCVVVAGGSTRQSSVLAALRAAAGAKPGESESRVVFIHDAVRPFVATAMLDEVLAAAIEYGGAAPALPVTDTLRRAAGGVFKETVDRSSLYRMQTPQAFRETDILLAHERAEQEGWEATDDVELYARYIGPVRLVPGSAANVKITTVEDLATAERHWNQA